MNHGSLFSGIGGFDLAAEWMGWENVFHCEWNEFGQKVLKHYWPKAISYHDITKTNFTIHRGGIDILTGGFPCQPYSAAGKRLGKEDERHLWPEMRRAIQEIQPRWVVGENVRGLVNWNGGLVFDEVQADLENEGYEVQPFVLPACAKNAPHRRDRVWFVAYSNKCNGRRTPKQHEEKGGEKRVQERYKVWKFSKPSEIQRPTSDTASERRKEWEQDNRQTHSEENRPRLDDRPERYGNFRNDPDTESCGRGKIGGQRESRFLNETGEIGNWQKFPTQSPICGGNDGLPTQLDGITFSKWRNESIKAYGNAIVPQVVYEIFKTIQQYENNPPTLPPGI